MSETAGGTSCPNCGRLHPLEELDARGWCTGCRTEVIARSRRVAIAAAILAALGTLAAIVWLAAPTLRIPVVIWVVVAAAVYFVVFRLVRRVAFEIIRGRGVPPGGSDHGG